MSKMEIQRIVFIREHDYCKCNDRALEIGRGEGGNKDSKGRGSEGEDEVDEVEEHEGSKINLKHETTQKGKKIPLNQPSNRRK